MHECKHLFCYDQVKILKTRLFMTPFILLIIRFVVLLLFSILFQNSAGKSEHLMIGALLLSLLKRFLRIDLRSFCKLGIY